MELHDALAIREKNGVFTLKIHINGKAVEKDYVPQDETERRALAQSLRGAHPIVVEIDAGVFITGVREK